jgi:hypothetical protein
MQIDPEDIEGDEDADGEDVDDDLLDAVTAAEGRAKVSGDEEDGEED